MKKISFAFVLALLAILPSLSSAAIMLPSKVSIGDAPSYDAGKTVQMNLTDGPRSNGKQQMLEYGIARTLKSGEYTSFEILSTQSMDLSSLKAIGPLSLTIPNLLKDESTDTYVAYVKFFEKNNQDNEGFYFSNEFDIVLNNTPFINVRNINFLQSNGDRFATIEGPSIYTLDEVQRTTTTKLSTSTSLEITFESNQDTTVTPSILFSKIRSDSFTETFTGQPIQIKKGTNYVVIPLPTFNYVPGVYIGDLTFNGGLIKNKYTLQYIVSGDSVSIGTISTFTENEKNFFNFEIFGNPLDLFRTDLVGSDATSTPESKLYSVALTFSDASGSTLFNSMQNVDFSKQQFTLEIPKKYRNIEDVQITITSPTSGAIVYEATKNVAYKDTSTPFLHLVLYILLYVVLIIGMIIFLVKKHFKSFILFLVLLVGLYFVRDIFAQTVNIEQFSTEKKSVTFTNLNQSFYPTILLQDDVTQTRYECGKPIPVTFKVNYVNCTNATPDVAVGISQKSVADAEAKRKLIGLGSKSGAKIGSIRVGNRDHTVYPYLSQSVTTSLAAPTASTSYAYMFLRQNANPASNENRFIGYNKYKFPIYTTCNIDNKTTCSCSGRTEICKDSDGLTVSSVQNASSCAFKASCTFTTAENSVTFNTIVSNALGAVTYKDADSGQTITNPYTRTLSVGQTIVQRTIATDIDGSTATVSCNATQTNTQCTPGTAGCPPCVPGTPNCPGVVNPPCVAGSADCPPEPEPEIEFFTIREKVVYKNRSCEYSWTAKDVDRCALIVNDKKIPLSGSGITGTNVPVPAADGNNQRAFLTCVADKLLPKPKATVASTTLCQVIPEVIER